MSHSTGMQIRVLHGTYTHDRDQVSIFDNLRLPYTRAEVINKLTCEELTDFNNKSDMKLRVLYVPDNLPYKHSTEVMDHIADIYKCLGWDKVDIVLGHGSFDYALGCSCEHLPECTYTIDQFKPYVKDDGLIIMGHIHRPSHRANVYYCGSFDRMVHGEEEAKKAESGAKALFSSGDAANMPEHELSDDDYYEDGNIGLLDILVKSGLTSSKAEARRAVNQGGVSVNGDKVTDATITFAKDAIKAEPLVIKKGKKNFIKIK
jgi:hypothetical protein